MKSILHQFVSRLSAVFQEKTSATIEDRALLHSKECISGRSKPIAANVFKTFLVFLFVGAYQVDAQTILTWNTFGNTGTETTEPSTSNTNVAATTLNYTGSSVIAASNTNRFGGTNWGLATLSTTSYI